MRNFVILLFLSVLLGPLGASGKVLILDYHTFLDSGTSSMDYSLKEFGDQLDKMQALGYRLVSLSDALSGKLEGDNNIAITIDDGHKTVYDAVTQVVFPRKIPVELFIFPGPLSRSVHYLKVEQLLELLDGGCDMGAHGYHHNYMSATAWAKNSADVLFEAQRPADALKKLTGRTPTLFAYPFGVAGPEARGAVKGAGYEWAFLADGKIAPFDPADPKLDHWEVPRTIVYRGNVKALFQYLESHANKGTRQDFQAPMPDKSPDHPPTGLLS